MVSISTETNFHLLYIHSSLMSLWNISIDIMIMVKGVGMAVSSIKWSHRIAKIDEPVGRAELLTRATAEAPRYP